MTMYGWIQKIVSAKRDFRYITNYGSIAMQLHIHEFHIRYMYKLQTQGKPRFKTPPKQSMSPVSKFRFQTKSRLNYTDNLH